MEQNTFSPKKEPSKILLYVGIIALIYIFVPEPSDLIPGLGWIDEILAGGISLSTLITYFFRYWFYQKVSNKLVKR